MATLSFANLSVVQLLIVLVLLIAPVALAALVIYVLMRLSRNRKTTMERMRKLVELRANGRITEAEYERRRTEILKRL